MTAPNTEMQRRFALEYASGSGNASDAARKAGYSAKSAAEIGRQLLEKPHVREMISQELVKLRVRSGTIGLNALTTIAGDSKMAPAARVAAARALLEHAGLVGSGKDAREPGDQPGAEITDYEQFLERLGQSRRVANG